MSLLSSSESSLIVQATMELLMELCLLLMKKKTITVTTEDKGDLLNAKKTKLKARAANKMGYRDLVMSTEGISLNIVENAISEELTKGDLKKAWERLERGWNPKTREAKSRFTQNSSTTSWKTQDRDLWIG